MTKSEPTTTAGPTGTTEHRPRPTPTGRARRAAAAGVEVRRPSPRPTTDTAPSIAKPKTQPTDEPPRTRRAERARVDRDRAKLNQPRPVAHRSGARAPLWLGLLLGLFALIGAAAVVVALVLPTQSGSVRVRDQALSAAKSEVPLILSYDYKSFDAGLAKGKGALTGRAVADYQKAMTTSIKPNAVKVKAVVQASTDGGGIEAVSSDGKQVTVVVFGEQKVTNSSLSAPRTDIFRVRATLDLVRGHWLVSKFDPI